MFTDVLGTSYKESPSQPPHLSGAQPCVKCTGDAAHGRLVVPLFTVTISWHDALGRDLKVCFLLEGLSKPASAENAAGPQILCNELNNWRYESYKRRPNARNPLDREPLING